MNGVGSEQSHHSLNFFLAVETSDRFNRGIKRHAICYHKTTSLITQRLYRPLFAYYHMHDNLPHCAISELNFYNITTRHTRVAQHMLENPPFIDMCSLRVPGVPGAPAPNFKGTPDINMGQVAHNDNLNPPMASRIPRIIALSKGHWKCCACGSEGNDTRETTCQKGGGCYHVYCK